MTKELRHNTIIKVSEKGAKKLMQIDIKCPSCTSDSSFFIAKNVFQGPFRCWKCKALYSIKVRDSELEKCEPLSNEDFEKQKADRAAKRKKAKEKTA